MLRLRRVRPQPCRWARKASTFHRQGYHEGFAFWALPPCTPVRKTRGSTITPEQSRAPPRPHPSRLMTLHPNYPASEHAPPSGIAEVTIGKCAFGWRAIFSVHGPMSDEAFCIHRRCARAEHLQARPSPSLLVPHQRKYLGCRAKCPSSRLRRQQPGCVPYRRKIPKSW